MGPMVTRRRTGRTRAQGAIRARGTREQFKERGQQSKALANAPKRQNANVYR